MSDHPYVDDEEFRPCIGEYVPFFRIRSRARHDGPRCIGGCSCPSFEECMCCCGLTHKARKQMVEMRFQIFQESQEKLDIMYALELVLIRWHDVFGMKEDKQCHP
jgi:hypothetical protein